MITLTFDDKEEEALARALAWAIEMEIHYSYINKKESPRKLKQNMMFLKRYNKLVEKIREGEKA